MSCRALAVLCLLLISLGSCDSKKEKERAAAQKAALEEIETQLRPRTEKRLAVLKGIAEIHRGEPAPIRLGDRPPVKMLIADSGPSFPPPGERGFNGRALPSFDVADLSRPALEKPLSLFGDRKWIDEGLPALRNPQSVGAKSSRDRIQEFLSVRYLAVVCENSYVEPKVEYAAAGGQFRGGRITATFHLFDLEDGSCLGGSKVEAASSQDVQYRYRSVPDNSEWSAKDAREKLASAIRYDLRANLEKAILKALEPFAAK